MVIQESDYKLTWVCNNKFDIDVSTNKKDEFKTIGFGVGIQNTLSYIIKYKRNKKHSISKINDIKKQHNTLILSIKELVEISDHFQLFVTNTLNLSNFVNSKLKKKLKYGNTGKRF